MIDRIAISGYRSIRSIILRLGQWNVVTGANGSGKSNLYRALRLIADAADGRLAESLAHEGGFDSARWAGPKKSGKDPVSLRLGFAADPLRYCFDLGLPQPSESVFDGDPEMKRECLWRGVGMGAKDMCADRRVRTLRCPGASGKRQDIDVNHGCRITVGNAVRKRNAETNHEHKTTARRQTNRHCGRKRLSRIVDGGGVW